MSNHKKGYEGSSLDNIIKSIECFLKQADWYARQAKNEIVAFYISESKRKKKLDRPPDSVDDYYKAEYLNYLADYLGQEIRLDEEFSELIVMVYKIFERAFYNKIDHSHWSDLQCFTEAERYYCEKKAIEYCAYFEYEDRRKQGSWGDTNSDYYLAEKKIDLGRREMEN